MSNIQQKITSITKKINHYQDQYSKGISEISDLEFDQLFDQLKELEKQYPQYADKNSPTQRVGSDLDTSFEQVKHDLPVLSLDKCYSINELENYITKNFQKINSSFHLIAEEKMDGVSVVLTYDQGQLNLGASRGNGIWGNDITENIKTVKDIPLNIEYEGKLIVRGELYIAKNDFKKIKSRDMNLDYANPRNLAAGIIRRKSSKEVAKYPLSFFAYEALLEDRSIESHHQVLNFLQNIHFKVNPNYAFFRYDEVEKITEYIETETRERKALNYEIDGLVFKIDEYPFRELLGITSHHPRWAIAYKFEAPMAQTEINNIIFQVGRGGRITPVAILEPVHIAGSKVSRATLHNKAYMEELEIGIGDVVTISKRGDIIPAVEEVIEHHHRGIFSVKFPTKCPACSTDLIVEGAHHFCPSKTCSAQELNQLIFFASRNMMDIRGLGKKTIEYLYEKRYVQNIPDLYNFDYHQLLGQEGYQQKKIQNIIDSLNQSKEKPFRTLFSALGFKDIGPKVVQYLVDAGLNSFDQMIEVAKKGDREIFLSIPGIGDKIAHELMVIFSKESTIDLINQLDQIGLNLQETQNNQGIEKIFDGETWVITGSYENFKSRNLIADEITRRGGSVTTSVSKNTDVLLCGKNPGSKLDKAQNLGVIIMDENEFMNKLNIGNIEDVKN